MITAAPCARASDDPVLGPAPGLPMIEGPTTSSFGGLYRDYLQQLREKLVARIPGRDEAGELVEGRARSHEQRARIGPIGRSENATGAHTFVGIHLRRALAVQSVVGDPEPTDVLTPFPGVLVAGRLGLDFGWIAFYAITAAGGYQISLFDLGAEARALGRVGPSMIWSGALLGGFGAEVSLGRSVSFGLEATSMALTARSQSGQVLAPDPSRSVQLGVGAIRIRY